MDVNGERSYVTVRHTDFSYDYNNSLSYRSNVADSQDAVRGTGGANNITWSYCRFNRPGETAFKIRGDWDEITIKNSHFRYTTFDSTLSGGGATHGELRLRLAENQPGFLFCQ